MGFLRAILGPSKDEIWTQIAAEIGGEFIEGGFWEQDALMFHHGEWELLLDTYTVRSGSGNTASSTTYTRMRAPFVNRDGLYFRVSRAGLFSGLGRFFGMQDIEVGDSAFDEAFVVKGNDERQVRRLLADARLRALLDEQPLVHFEVRDDDGWFGEQFPDGVDQLYFRCHGVLRDTEHLKALFALFMRALECLVAIDSAYADDPNVEL